MEQDILLFLEVSSRVERFCSISGKKNILGDAVSNGTRRVETEGVELT